MKNTFAETNVVLYYNNVYVGSFQGSSSWCTPQMGLDVVSLFSLAIHNTVNEKTCVLAVEVLGGGRISVISGFHMILISHMHWKGLISMCLLRIIGAPMGIILGKLCIYFIMMLT